MICEVCKKYHNNKRYCSNVCRYMNNGLHFQSANEKRRLGLMKSGRFGKHNSEQMKKKQSIALRGNIPWNTGLTKISSISLLQGALKKKGRPTWNKGLTKETDERIRKSSKNLKRAIICAYAEGRKTVSNINSCYERSKMWCKYDYKWVIFRSSYERIFAEFLNLIFIPWQYEPKVFHLKSTTYRPDFYLPKTNCWVEIKGYLRNNSAEKINLMLQYYGISILILNTTPIKWLKKILEEKHNTTDKQLNEH